MPSPYIPVAAWDDEIELPDDGDDMDASSVSTPIEAVLDRTEALRAGELLTVVTITATGAWVAPAGAKFAIVEGCGGGGGGGSGASMPPEDSPERAGGGGGGGGARVSSRFVSLTPAASYVVTIGAGGSGPAIGSGASGGDGATTTLDALASFDGASGGYAGQKVATAFRLAPGGTPARSNDAFAGTQGSALTIDAAASVHLGQHGQGGWGSAGGTGYQGYRSERGFAGGVYGVNGASDGVKLGGGGGGGGGAGPAGDGAVGGIGGSGDAGGGGESGGSGITAPPNTGAGGGGGGGAGSGIAGTVAGGGGGAGGSGFVRLIVFRGADVP